MVSFRSTIRCPRNSSEKLKPLTSQFQGLLKENLFFLIVKITYFGATTRDGRVSDTTTRLVQKLLNLNPHQRLKAHQVVAVLDSTIATSHLSSSPERSLLQVRVKLVKLFIKLRI